MFNNNENKDVIPIFDKTSRKTYTYFTYCHSFIER